VSQAPFFYAIWHFSPNKQSAKDLLAFISKRPPCHQLVHALFGFDLPLFKSFYLGLHGLPQQKPGPNHQGDYLLPIPLSKATLETIHRKGSS